MRRTPEQESHAEQLKSAYVIGRSGSAEEWTVLEESENFVRVGSRDERGKERAEMIPREVFERLNASEARVAVKALKNMEADERSKIVVLQPGEEYKNPRLEEIKTHMREMSEGDYEAPRAFLAREALTMAEESYGIKVKDLEELHKRVREKQRKLRERVAEIQGEWDDKRALLDRARTEGDEGKITRLESDVMDLSSARERLRWEEKDNFARIQKLLDVIDALDKLREKG